MLCRDFILSDACESCLFLFAQLIVPYPDTYFLLDMEWTKDEREQFLNIINTINEMGEMPEERM